MAQFFCMAIKLGVNAAPSRKGILQFLWRHFFFTLLPLAYLLAHFNHLWNLPDPC